MERDYFSNDQANFHLFFVMMYEKLQQILKKRL